jgi:hypothetical protein
VRTGAEHRTVSLPSKTSCGNEHSGKPLFISYVSIAFATWGFLTLSSGYSSVWIVWLAPHWADLALFRTKSACYPSPAATALTLL